MRRRSVRPYFTPPPNLFIVLGQLWEVGVGTVVLDQGVIRKHHVAAAHWRPQGWFGRSVGSADPLWAPVVVCFHVVAVRWALKLVLGIHRIWRRFGRVCGPWDTCDARVSASDSSGVSPLEW
jgi:hypothetical protein